MGYKSRGISRNSKNHNRCQRKYKGARPNGPPSPISNAMRLFIDKYAHTMTQSQMLIALNACFGKQLTPSQLKAYLRYHPTQFSRTKTSYILDIPNFKGSGDELDNYLENLEDPLDVADLLPESTKKAYDKLYEE